jgi:tetratricopeptide (TPR) repeat protein
LIERERTVEVLNPTHYGSTVSVQLDGRRIFLASPGGLESERSVIRGALFEFNVEEAFDRRVAFIPTGWEMVPGGVARPQEKINQQLRGCDFVIVMLWDRWGSGTGNPIYSSGTEEEFYEAIAALADMAQPLRDILVLFKPPTSEQLRDPGPQLAQVLAFREGLEQSSGLFFNTFDSDDELRGHLRRKLREWSGELDPKVSISLELRRPELNAKADAFLSRAADQTLDTAMALAANGLVTQAEVAFQLASADGSPQALIEHARFMRRMGRLERAAQLNEELLSVPALATATDPLSFAQRADAISNIGVIRRKQGNLVESERKLTEAAATARLAGGVGRRVLSYALDNLGLTRQHLGQLDAADEAFLESLALRRETGDRSGEAQALINRARLARLRGDLDRASALADQAATVLDGDSAPALRATALATAADIASERGDFHTAMDLLNRSLELNTTLNILDGRSIALVQLARVALAMGDESRARRNALEAVELNEQTSNFEGTAIARQLIAEIDLAFGASDEGMAGLRRTAQHWREARDYGRESHARCLLSLELARRCDVDAARVELAEARAASSRAQATAHVNELMAKAEAALAGC